MTMACALVATWGALLCFRASAVFNNQPSLEHLTRRWRGGGQLAANIYVGVAEQLGFNRMRIELNEVTVHGGGQGRRCKVNLYSFL